MCVIFFVANYLCSLFVLPMYCGALLEQSLMFNRRRHDKEVVWGRTGYHYVGNDHKKTDNSPKKDEADDDVVPMIYACATMWHETRDEMTQLLKSLFRYPIIVCASNLFFY